jgi:hypothetical protein
MKPFFDNGYDLVIASRHPRMSPQRFKQFHKLGTRGFLAVPAT